MTPMTEQQIRDWLADESEFWDHRNIRTRPQLMPGLRAMAADLDRQRALAASLSERLAAASAVLSRCAERGKVVRCLRCTACRGRGRFDLSPVCHWCAGSGLELTAAAGDADPTEPGSPADAAFAGIMAGLSLGVAVLDDPEADLTRPADDGGPHAGEG